MATLPTKMQPGALVVRDGPKYHFTFANREYITTDHAYKLLTSHCRIDMCKNVCCEHINGRFLALCLF